MDRIEIISTEDVNILSIEMDKYQEKSKYLMTLAQDKGLTIQKYYWRSIKDRNYIEYIEPKVYDAFVMCIDIIGDYDIIQQVLRRYKKVCNYLNKLFHIAPITDEEIKKYSMRFSIL